MKGKGKSRRKLIAIAGGILAICIIAGIIIFAAVHEQKESSQSDTTKKSETTVTWEKGAADGFQKNMHQSLSFFLSNICEAEDGYYFEYNGYVYYLDKGTNTAAILCSKADCEHNDTDCNAYIGAASGFLDYYGGMLFYVNSDAVLKNGSWQNDGDRLYSLSLDGTVHTIVQALGEASTGTTSPMLHKGKLYFADDQGVLYEDTLEDGSGKMEVVYGEDDNLQKNSASDSIKELGSSSSYTLWADGDLVYFMTSEEQEDGTYKDILYSYQPDTEKVTQVWKVPEASEVGEWETTGVSVTQWYVTDGYIYYYLAGADFWRTDLETGKNEKLAQTSDMSTRFDAIFSDQYLCLLDNDEFDLQELEYSGGETIYVYSLEGELITTLSLSSLLEEDASGDFTLVFCSENHIYLLADVGTWNVGDGISQKDVAYILYCVDIDSGEITLVSALDE